MRGLNRDRPGGTPHAPAGRPDNGERGVTLAMVAILLVTLVGAASLVIDLGNGWLTRRSLVPATDSAALAAAQGVVAGQTTQAECDATAVEYVGYNAPGATVDPCDMVAYSADRGRVTVTASQNVDTWLAGVIGGGDFPTSSTSSVAWGPPAAATGLRPIGLCLDGSAALRDVVQNPPSVPTDVVVAYNKDQPTDCGGTSIPGNWGTIDFDGGSNSNDDTKEWIEFGYPGEVTFSYHSISDCDAEAHCYPGDTGGLSGVAKELDDLEDSGAYFTLPVFNFVENPGGNAEFHLAGILRVRLLDFKLNGKDADRFIEIRVEPGLVSGPCCGPPGGASGNKVTAICGVDPGQYAACEP